MDVHEHCIRLRGLNPDDTRKFLVVKYADPSLTPQRMVPTSACSDLETQ